MIRLLLVDDEPQLIRALRPALNAEGYEMSAAETGLDAIAQMAAEPSDVILLDLGLPDMDGKEVIRRPRRAGSPPRRCSAATIWRSISPPAGSPWTGWRSA